MIAIKMKFLFFLLKTYFQSIFYSKHIRNLVKPVYDLQICKKPPQNLKSTENQKYFQAHIYFFKNFQDNKKNPLNLIFHLHMEAFATIIECFGIKIEFFKIKGTDHLITKKKIKD